MSFFASNSFRPSGYSADRRRRLLADEPAGPDDWPGCRMESDDAASPRKSEHYGDAEFLVRQMRLLDLAPRRRISLFLLLAFAGGTIAALDAGHVWMIGRVAEGLPPIAAFDMTAAGSLYAWLSSLLCLGAAAATMLTYSVRRHRIDDYQGRYRIWLSAAACCVVLAGTQAANLREAFRDLMTAATGSSLIGDGTLWWAALDLFLLAAVGSRVLIDVRECRSAFAALLLAAVAHMAATVSRLGWISPVEGPQAIEWLARSEMVAVWLLLAGILLYLRNVILDAEGLLPHKAPRVSPTPADSPQQPVVIHPAARPRIDAAHAAPPVPAPLAPVQRKLTKGERKALKERLLRERLERERRAG